MFRQYKIILISCFSFTSLLSWSQVAEAATLNYSVVESGSTFYTNVFSNYNGFNLAQSDNFSLGINSGNIQVDDVTGKITFDLNFTVTESLVAIPKGGLSQIEFLPVGTTGRIHSETTGNQVYVDSASNSLVATKGTGSSSTFQGTFKFSNFDESVLTVQEGGAGCTLGKCINESYKDLFSTMILGSPGSRGLPIGFGISSTGGNTFSLVMGEFFLASNFVADNAQFRLNLIGNNIPNNNTSVPEPASMALLISGLSSIGALKRKRKTV